MGKFFGVVPPVVTAFAAGGSLNLRQTQQFIRHLIDQGVHGIFVAGSTGEYTLLSLQERKDLFAAGVEAVDGRVPLLAGTAISSRGLETNTSSPGSRIRIRTWITPRRSSA